MNDDGEDEIIYQMVSTHWHMVWKFTSVTSHKIATSLLPGPGESMRSVLLQPAPFMMLTLFLIVLTIVLQSRHQWVQNIVKKYQNAVCGKGLSPIVSIPILGKEIQEFHDGIAGGYAIRGRRSAMEDRYSIMQDVDVADGKKVSFFGVFDGHGGDYVAEYVKKHLFVNTVKKLREQARKNLDLTNGLTGDAMQTERIRHTPSSERDGSPPQPDLERRESTANYAELTKETFGLFQAKLETLLQQHAQDDQEPRDNAKPEPQPETKTEPDNPKPEDPVPLKKDDPYSAVSLKKIKNKTDSIKTKEKSPPKDISYIDSGNNINYTKLLTDQLLEVDRKCVKHCKANVDLSGTTAVIAVIDGELLIIANVGDSRAVMGTFNGNTTALSIDHKPNQTKEKLRIKNNGGFITFNGVWRVAGILATSRALGDFVLKDPRKLVTAEPDVLTFSLKDHKAQFVILATDGVWDVMTNEDAVEFVAQHLHEHDFGAKSLVKEAYYRGSQDNITVVVLNIDKLRL